MNENSYLNPTNIQEESNSAISKLEKDNEAIRIAESSLNTFLMIMKFKVKHLHHLDSR